MTAEELFSILKLMSVAARLPLMFLPRARWAATVVPVVTPFLPAVIYVVLVAATLPRSEGGFSSLACVRALIDNPWALLAGWVHCLAFDLSAVGGFAGDFGAPSRMYLPRLIVHSNLPSSL